MYAIILRLEAKPERRDALREALIADAQASRRDEPGILRFDLLEDEHKPNCFCLYEVYRDRAALQAHVGGPNFQRFLQSVRAGDWLTRPIGQDPAPFAEFRVLAGSPFFPPEGDPDWRERGG